MNRCPACDRRAYYADVHCQRCGAAIVPPPPPWVRRLVVFLPWMFGIVLVFQMRHFVTMTAPGRALVEHAGDIAGMLLAFVVAPLVGLYFFLRAMVDVGDWLDLKMQQWRAERFRKHGW